MSASADLDALNPKFFSGQVKVEQVVAQASPRLQIVIVKAVDDHHAVELQGGCEVEAVHEAPDGSIGTRRYRPLPSLSSSILS